MTATRRATFLVNPAARGVARRLDAGRAVRYLRGRGIETDLRVTASAAELTALSREAAGRGDDLVFVAGGDGTLRDAARGLAGSETALAPVPAGTVNVFAREAGLPRGIRTALDAHIGGRAVRIDLGRANGEPFLLMASAGWDAAVARDVSLALKRRVGDLAYAVRAAAMLPGLRTIPAAWRTGEAEHEAPLALFVASNTRLYGGRVRFTPLALADDGELDVVVLSPRGLGDGLRMAYRVVRGTVTSDGRAFSARTPHARLATAGIPFQLDGDYAGETPLDVSIEPGALAVSIPAQARPEILSQGDGV